MSKLLTADPSIIEIWSQRNKCWMCKRRFDRPIILPVGSPARGKLQPNINVEVALHMIETHGMPTRDYVHNYVFNSIYGVKNTMDNLYGRSRIFKLGTGAFDDWEQKIKAWQGGEDV